MLVFAENFVAFVVGFLSSPGIEPGPHWWKASALTTAPSPLPLKYTSSCREDQRLSTDGKIVSK